MGTHDIIQSMNLGKIAAAAVLALVPLFMPFSARGENPSTVQKKLVLFGFEFGRCCDSKEKCLVRPEDRTYAICQIVNNSNKQKEVS